MKVTGIIAEYNPFHNGHEYHIREAKRLTGADYIVVIMSGNFVQRGEPAVIDKYTRTKMALLGGADLVLELPLICATGSAEYFASGAISLLHALGCIDALCFGSECDDLQMLHMIADILAQEPQTYRTFLKNALHEGLSYPKAREQAFCRYLSESAQKLGDSPQPSPSMIGDILSTPNNILAIEYLKALKRLNSSIEPLALKRAGSGYHDLRLTEAFCSASAIRAHLDELTEEVLQGIPASAANILLSEHAKTYPVTANDFSGILHYRLLMAESYLELASCYDVPLTLAQRIFRLRSEYTDFDSFVSLVKTKNVTELTVRRTLLHILLNLPHYFDAADNSPLGTSASFCGYARILGFKKNAAPLLRKIKEKGHLPLLSKLADAPSVIQTYDAFTSRQKTSALLSLQCDIRSSEIYHSVITHKFGGSPYQELAQQLVIL